MGNEISYSQPTPLTSSIAVPATVATGSETDIFKLTDQQFLKKSQLSVLFDITLGSATKVQFRYYLFDGTNWYPIPVKNLSTGQLVDTPSVIDSTTYVVTGSQHRVVEYISLVGCAGFKITAIPTGATATINALQVYAKDN